MGEKYSEFFEKLRTLKDITPQTSKYLREYFEIYSQNSKMREELDRANIEKNFFGERLNQ
jgi:hypothetical protein